MPIKYLTPEGGGECGGYLAYWNCPICGLPVVEGQCRAGHEYYIKTIPLKSLPQFLKDKEIGRELGCRALDKSESYYPLEEQYITLELYSLYDEKEPLSEILTVRIDKKYAHAKYIIDAVEDIVAEYFYRPRCKNPVKIFNKYYKKERERKMMSVRLTPTLSLYLREASRFFGISKNKLIESYARKWWADEVEI